MSTHDVSGGSSDLKNTLGHLNTLLQPLPLSENYSFHSSLPRSMPNIKLLPSALVVGILQRFKSMAILYYCFNIIEIDTFLLIHTARRPIFLSSYAMTDLKLVESLCQSIYFPITPITIGQITSMHGIFSCLLKESEAMKDPLCQQFDFSAHLAQCEKNLVMGIETYEIMAVPSFDNILGLTMGVSRSNLAVR